jgi:RNA recognition motif-containing protein
MSKNIYVGNLNFATTEAELEQMFAEFGTVQSAKVITDRETGRSRGFGFVEMENEADGDAAIEAMNGKEIEGRSLTVNEARPRTGGGGGGGGRGGRGGGRPRY